MALRDKLNSLAAEAASKANTAIENGKLSLKINNEEKKIDEFTLNIGELVLDKLDGGETFDDEIMALYSSIQAAREVIARARADIEASRQGEEAEEDALSPTCSSCGAALSQDCLLYTSAGPVWASSGSCCGRARPKQRYSRDSLCWMGSPLLPKNGQEEFFSS